jgi:hypothetical protein
MILLERTANGRIRHERRILLAFLSRVRDGGVLRDTARLLARIRTIDLGLHVVLALAVVALPGIATAVRVGLFGVVTLSLVVGGLCWFFYGWKVRQQRMPRVRSTGWRAPLTMHTSELIQVIQVVFLIYLLAVRGVLAPAAITLVEQPWSRSGLISGAPAIGAIALTMWTPMAVTAAVTGMLTGRGWWLVLTLFPLAVILRHPLQAMRGLGWLLRRFWIFLALLVVLGAGGGLGMGQVERAAPRVAPFILYGMFGFGALVLLAGIVRWLADWRRYQEFGRAEGPLPVADFSHALDVCFSNPARVRIIRLVAARTALPPTPETVGAIRDLSLSLERDLRRRSLDPSAQRAYAWQLMFHGRLPGRLVLWDHAVLDELLRLEQRLMDSRPAAVAHASKP